MKLFLIFTLSLFSHFANASSCYEHFYKHYPQLVLPFEMEGLLISSLTDKTQSTGATLFYFPNGAGAVADVRGGSVASSETTLLIPGSYSHIIDGLVFAGGSTMGLEAGDGVRRVLFRERAEDANQFDFIPSVPTAVVYDYSGRVFDYNDPLVYPDLEMGQLLMNKNNLKSEFVIGRAGAGVSSTANKIRFEDGVIWGGQGAAFGKVGPYKIFAAVVLNPVGDVRGRDGESLSLLAPYPLAPGVNGPKQNTTLSVIITDAPLNRNQLQRLAIAVHTSMGGNIYPFHTYTDGDIHFAVTLNPMEVSHPEVGGVLLNENTEMQLTIVASELMKKAIITGAKVANDIPLERRL